MGHAHDTPEDAGIGIGAMAAMNVRQSRRLVACDTVQPSLT